MCLCANLLIKHLIKLYVCASEERRCIYVCVCVCVCVCGWGKELTKAYYLSGSQWIHTYIHEYVFTCLI